MRLSIEQALAKGIEAQDAGQLEIAEQIFLTILKKQRNHPEANYHIGLIQTKTGNIASSLPFFRTSLQSNPKVTRYWKSYVISLIQLNHLYEADRALAQARSKGARGMVFDELESLLENEKKQLLTTDDNQTENVEIKSADWYFKAGADLLSEGKYDIALENFEKGITIKPEYADAYNSIGAIKRQQGKLKEAIKSYQQAIKLNPEFPAAYINLGVVIRDLGNFEKAIKLFEQAIEIEPQLPAAYTNVAITFRKQGKYSEAITALQESITLQPNAELNYSLLSEILKNVRFEEARPDLYEPLEYILDKKTIANPKRIVAAVISFLKYDPNIENILQKNIEKEIKGSVINTIKDLIKVPLLLKFMAHCSLPDLEFESLLRSIRSAILSNITNFTDDSEILAFQEALALQCFANEYVYDVSKYEFEILGILENHVENNLKNGIQPTSIEIACLGSYKALFKYSWINEVVVGPELQDLFDKQLYQPRKESELGFNIAKLKAIKDNVSLKVREQYEENPYPRWEHGVLHDKKLSVQEFVRGLDLKIKPLDNSSNHLQVLVAGCGTGQHSISVATRFKNCEVIAADLSLNSLTYAKRKSLEMGVLNIDYVQADILDIVSLGQKFDIIETVGVLHHMQDPVLGWRTLVKCLKPGGLMRIGLYSHIARQPIVKIRKEIAGTKLKFNNEDIKKFRQTIIKSDEEDHALLKRSEDFYNLSGFRDLLFHVQEHSFSLPQIQKILLQLELNFCGFENRFIKDKFISDSKNQKLENDLDIWHKFEVKNPRIFAGMYVFWCQRLD